MSNKSNKHRERTEDWRKETQAQMVNDIVVNDIEKHNFDKLVHSGVVVREVVTA